MNGTKIGAKVMSTPALKRLNDKAVAGEKNRSLTDEFFLFCDPEGIHVVFFSMIHNDREMRVGIKAKLKGEHEPTTVYLDMEFEDFEALPEVPDGDEEA